MSNLKASSKSFEHQSVMTREVLEALDLHDGELVIDATTGQGGHSESILQSANIRLIAMDADPVSVEASKNRLEQFGNRAEVIEANFRDIGSVIGGRPPAAAALTTRPDRILFDLGWNRNQLTSGKGFSFQGDEPLTMSYGPEPVSGFTASGILNSWSEEAIANVLFGYGNERYARRIAKNVVLERGKMPIITTQQFVSVIEGSVPMTYRRGSSSAKGGGRKSRHFATKSFQALRIAVNDEMGSLEKGLRGAWDILASNGRIVVITFHSLEDRLVKKLFVEFAGDGGTLVNKKPITPTREEIISNPAARSAKLRAIIKN